MKSMMIKKVRALWGYCNQAMNNLRVETVSNPHFEGHFGKLWSMISKLWKIGPVFSFKGLFLYQSNNFMLFDETEGIFSRILHY